MKIGFYKQNFTRYKTIQKKADLNNTNNVFYNDRVVKSGLNQLANINKTFINLLFSICICWGKDIFCKRLFLL